MKPIVNTKRQLLADIWNSDLALAYRSCFYNNSYSEICDESACPYLIDSNKVVAEKHYLTESIRNSVQRKDPMLPVEFARVKLDTDLRCNLFCVMCRKDRILTTENQITKFAIKSLSPHWSHIKELSPAVAGETLFIPEIKALLMSRRLIRNNIGLELVTNGTLFSESLWEKIKHNRFSFVKVSADSLKKETYERIRRGADYEELMKNISFISGLRRQGHIEKTQLTAIAMKSNLDELAEFIRFGKKFDFDIVKFLGLNGELVPEEKFDEADLCKLKHILSDPVFHDPVVDLWGLLRYRK